MGRGAGRIARCAAMIVAFAATLAWSGPAPVPALPAADAPEGGVEQLEKAFWVCDYVATTEGVLAAPLAACRFVNEELMRLKFAGDLDALLHWWRENKAAEHLKLARIPLP